MPGLTGAGWIRPWPRPTVTSPRVQVEASEETQREIDIARAGYIPVANRAQILYFCLDDLSRLDPMYQYSLEWFTAIFAASMRSSAKEEELSARIRAINEAFTFSLYGNVCRSLFERHKLWFAVLVCARVLLDRGRIDRAEWLFLLSGGGGGGGGGPDSAEAVSGSSAMRARVAPSAAPPRRLALNQYHFCFQRDPDPNPAPGWLSPRAWAELVAMRRLERLKEFAESVPKSLSQLKAVFDSPHPQR